MNCPSERYSTNNHKSDFRHYTVQWLSTPASLPLDAGVINLGLEGTMDVVKVGSRGGQYSEHSPSRI